MRKASNRNRTAGHNFERSVVKRLIERGWDAASSRYVSRKLDDEGVDIATDYPFMIQCKATVSTPPMHDLLTATAANVVFWRRMEKHGERFYSTGEYAVLKLDDFLNLTNKK